MRAQADRVKANPWIPETDPVRLAVLGKLGEELGELTAATNRCIIQGIHEREPVTGEVNRHWLEDEIGDVLAGVEMASKEFVLDRDRIERRRLEKLEHLQSWHNLIRLGDKGIDRVSMPTIACDHRFVRPAPIDCSSLAPGVHVVSCVCCNCGAKVEGSFSIEVMR